MHPAEGVRLVIDRQLDPYLRTATHRRPSRHRWPVDDRNADVAVLRWSPVQLLAQPPIDVHPLALPLAAGGVIQRGGNLRVDLTIAPVGTAVLDNQSVSLLCRQRLTGGLCPL